MEKHYHSICGLGTSLGYDWKNEPSIDCGLLVRLNNGRDSPAQTLIFLHHHYNKHNDTYTDDKDSLGHYSQYNHKFIDWLGAAE